jgi:GNAT superfamily N-acetyltransferase
MKKLEVRLLSHHDKNAIDRYLRIYARSFNPDERVSQRILRRVIQPSPARVNPVHLFAAYKDRKLVGGACTLVLPMFQVVFGSYIFVDPAMRGQGMGTEILKKVMRLERIGAHGKNWRMYGEVTASSGDPWARRLAAAGFRFFKTPWPLGSYDDPNKVVWGRLCYCDLSKPPERFSQPALLTYIHSLFYGPAVTHRHLLPRLKHFVRNEAP